MSKGAAERAAIKHNIYDCGSEDEPYPCYCHPDYERDILMIPMTKRQLAVMLDQNDSHAWGPGSRPMAGTMIKSRWIGPRWCLGEFIASIRYDLRWETDARARRTMITLIGKLESVLSTTTEGGAL